MLNASQIDLIVYDFDGVMTNNLVLVSQEGSESVFCSRGDGLGVSKIKSLGIGQVIVSTETNIVVSMRADKLSLPVLQGVDDKKQALMDYCEQNGIQLDRVLYVGNDTNDLEVMNLVGYPVCPCDAHADIHAIAVMKTKAHGGSGVVREIADWLSYVPGNPEQVPGNDVNEANDASDITGQLEDSIRLRKAVINDGVIMVRILEIVYSVVNALKNGNKIIFAGNGGSFADAQHLSAEFVGRFILEREPLAAVCLGTNSSLTTAVGNDYSFDDIFCRELKALARTGDVFIVLSTSGNSMNLLNAVEFANQIGIQCFGLLGKGGGKIAEKVNGLIVPHDNTARIQEMHITFGHLICDLVDKKLLTK